MLDLFLVSATEPKADIRCDILEDRLDAIFDRLLRHVELHCHVAASDVEAHAANRDMLVVSDDAADWLRVTKMAVGAQDTAAHAAVLHVRAICSLVRSSCSPKILASVITRSGTH